MNRERRAHGIRPIPSGADELKTPLGVLLEDKDLLLKVLSYVMDDGLHECRLVCRQWREACGKLPLKLAKVRFENVRSVVRWFPETTSLVFCHALCTACIADRIVTRHLEQLKNLRHLHLHLSYGQPARDSCITWFPVIDRLETLSLQIEKNDTLLDVFRLLRCLQKLLSLKLVVGYYDIQTELDPVTELRGLKELTVDIQVLVNKRAELVFPSLTALSCLNIDARRPVRHPPYNTVDLKVNTNFVIHSTH